MEGRFVRGMFCRVKEEALRKPRRRMEISWGFRGHTISTKVKGIKEKRGEKWVHLLCHFFVLNKSSPSRQRHYRSTPIFLSLHFFADDGVACEKVEIVIKLLGITFYI